MLNRDANYFFASATTVPFLALQSASVIGVTPLPLQAFLPAQSLPAPPQAPLPLHSLRPTHFTFAASLVSFAGAAAAALSAAKAPMANIEATAPAISVPFFICFVSLGVLKGPLWTKSHTEPP